MLASSVEGLAWSSVSVHVLCDEDDYDDDKTGVQETSPPYSNDVDDNKMRCLNPYEHLAVRTGHNVAASAIVISLHARSQA